MNSLEEQIIQLLTTSGNKPMTSGDIARALKLRGKPGKKLYKCLNKLVSAGEIARARKDKYILAGPADLVTGRLDVLRSGNGFVSPVAPGPDVFVSSRDMGLALPGDKVVIRLYPETRGKGAEARSGKVIQIVERRRHDIVGTLNSTSKFLYVVPIDPGYSQNFYVPETGGARNGDRVVIRFTEWLNKHVSPEAEIVEVLGPQDDPSLDTKMIVRHHGFRTEFPHAVISEAESVSELVDQPGDRVDFRDTFVLTIDPERARDFDDALSLEKDEDGNRVLGVHIADVSHFVRKGSALDKEAHERGTSVYLPDMVIPMLPEQLSNSVCSLRPREDRLAFSVFMTFDEDGTVIKRDFARTVINSNVRLNYKQAFAILEGKKVPEVKVQEVPGKLKDLNALAQQLRTARFARFALDLDIPECEVVLDDNSMMTGIRLVEYDISHQLIEECMVAANEAVAQFLCDSGLPVISRFHDKPQPEKLEDLQVQLAEMGYNPGDLSKPRNLAAFLKKLKTDPLAHSVRVAVLRSMQRAIYSADERGHYGLAKSYYSHFTSPIRRYPDLVTHRQLGDFIFSKKKTTYSKEQLGGISQLCTLNEQNADDAERAILEIKKYRFLEYQIETQSPQEYDAVVVKVGNIGMFVEILDLQLQGLVHISNISNRFVKFNKKKNSLRSGNKQYKVSDRIRVYPSNVDFDKRRIDFGLA